jgi:hypothetical protein
MEEPEFDFVHGKNIYFLQTSRPPVGPAQPPTYWVRGFLSLRVNSPEREAENSPLRGTEFKKAWNCNPSSIVSLRGVREGKFIFAAFYNP